MVVGGADEKSPANSNSSVVVIQGGHQMHVNQDAR